MRSTVTAGGQVYGTPQDRASCVCAMVCKKRVCNVGLREITIHWSGWSLGAWRLPCLNIVGQTLTPLLPRLGYKLFCEVFHLNFYLPWFSCCAYWDRAAKHEQSLAVIIEVV